MCPRTGHGICPATQRSVYSLGADDVIDYHATRFEETLRGIDMVLDTIGGETRERSWRVLRKGGVLITLVSPIRAGTAEQHGVRVYFSFVRRNRGQLDQINALVDAGKLTPVIAKTRDALMWPATLARIDGEGSTAQPFPAVTAL
jgi:NADPH:quinone reductase-like Zn-dependent oxidoreductase